MINQSLAGVVEGLRAGLAASGKVGRIFGMRHGVRGLIKPGGDGLLDLLADALGRPLRFLLTGGQVHESRTAEAMLEGVDSDAVIADKAYDSDAIRDTVKAARMKAVIPSNRSRKRPIRHDKVLYRERNRIERCFNKLKHFRRLATRYDRRAVHFLAFLCLAAAMLWMR